MNPVVKRILFALACAGLVGVIYVTLFGMPGGAPEPPPPPPPSEVPETPVSEPEPVPEPAPLAVSAARPDCPDCLALELAMLELGYLNQFLSMLQQVRQNAAQLPPEYSEVIADLVRGQHPILAPLIPATFGRPEDPNQSAGPALDQHTVLAIVQEQLAAFNAGGEGDLEEFEEPVPADTSTPLSIDDVRVVYARPGDGERQPRAILDVRRERQIIGRSRFVAVGGMNLELLDIIPSQSPADSRSQVIVRDRNSGESYTVDWL